MHHPLYLYTIIFTGGGTPERFLLTEEQETHLAIMNSDDPNYQNPNDPENNLYNSTYMRQSGIVSVPVVPPPPPQQRRQNFVMPAATITSGAYAQQQQQMVNVLF